MRKWSADLEPKNFPMLRTSSQQKSREERPISGTGKSFRQSEAVPPLYYKIPVLLVSITFMTFPKVVKTGT